MELTADIKEQIFTLPSFEEKEYKKKRYAGTPDLTVLKEGQREAYDKIMTFLEDGDQQMFLLSGFAGTGKTFIIGKIIESYFKTNRKSLVAMTAPTNQAVKVLTAFAEFEHTNLVYSTIHSLLGLKPKINSSGGQDFIQDRGKPIAIENYRLVIVDEVSMLDDNLFSYLLNYPKIKFLFLGDAAQIPPVGKLDAIPLQEAGQKKYGIGVASLTEIVRQAKGNPIIEVSTKIRNALGRSVTFPVRKTQIADGKGVIFLEKGNHEDGELVQEYLDHCFSSDNFKQDANFIKVLCWRNKTVKQMNDWIRRRIYNEDANQRIVTGEKLIAYSPIFDGKMIVFNTNDEFEVLDFREDYETVNDGQYEIKYYAARVEFVDHSGERRTHIIKIVHEESIGIYEEIKTLLADYAKSKPRGGFEAAQAWESFYNFQQEFADVNYGYCITCHRAQGTTYTNTLVLEHDIDANRNIVERNRIKYTACTRARELLLIVS